MQSLEEIIRAHPFFQELDPGFCRLVESCARNVRFDAGTYLFREGDDADQFYLVRHGRVAFEIAVPGRGPVQLMTIEEGEIAGVSWIVPPYRWNYDAKALELVRAIAMDAVCLRTKCEENHELGYELMKRFVPELVRRLHGARLQMLDVYGAQR